MIFRNSKVGKSKPSTVIIGVTGLPASGKNEFGEVAKHKGFKQIIMGDVIRNECIRRGLEPTRENSNKIMIQLRKEEGDGIVAQRVLQQVRDLLEKGENLILIDGLRSPEEVQLFREHFPNFKVIAIHASPNVRRARTLKRQRNDDSTSEEAFRERDEKELEVGIGNVIALADYLLSPPNNLQAARHLFKEFLNHLMAGEVN